MARKGDFHPIRFKEVPVNSVRTGAPIGSLGPNLGDTVIGAREGDYRRGEGPIDKNEADRINAEIGTRLELTNTKQPPSVRNEVPLRGDSVAGNQRSAVLSEEGDTREKSDIMDELMKEHGRDPEKGTDPVTPKEFDDAFREAQWRKSTTGGGNV